MEDKLVEKWVVICQAIVGCICSFLCPLFLGRDDMPAIGDITSVRLAIMLVSCTAAAGAYRAGYARRPHGIARDERSPGEKVTEWFIAFMGWMFLFFTSMCMGAHTSPNTVGLVFLSFAVYMLLEIARPVFGVYTVFYMYCGYTPIVAAVLDRGLDFLNDVRVLLLCPLAMFVGCWELLQMERRCRNVGI